MPHLVVSRRTGERIIITVPPSAEPQEIAVEYLERNGEQVRIGVATAKEVLIMRAELVPRREP